MVVSVGSPVANSRLQGPFSAPQSHSKAPTLSPTYWMIEVRQGTIEIGQVEDVLTITMVNDEVVCSGEAKQAK